MTQQERIVKIDEELRALRFVSSPINLRIKKLGVERSHLEWEIQVNENLRGNDELHVQNPTSTTREEES